MVKQYAKETAITIVNDGDYTAEYTLQVQGKYLNRWETAKQP